MGGFEFCGLAFGGGAEVQAVGLEGRSCERFEAFADGFLLGQDECQDASFAAEARGAAGAVEVGVIFVREVDVDDKLHLGHVEAAASQVGGDEDARDSAGEEVEDVAALLVRHVPLERVGGEARCLEEFREFRCALFGAEENDSAFWILDAQQLHEGDLFVVVEDVESEMFERLGDACAADADIGRVVQVALGEARDGGFEGCGDERGLLAAREGVEEFFDVGAEAHVEHAVGFVEDHEFNAVGSHFAGFEERLQSSGCRDDASHVASECAFLFFFREAARDGDASEGRACPDGAQFLGDLARKFSRGDENDDTKAAAFGADDHGRNAEGCGLA